MKNKIASLSIGLFLGCATAQTSHQQVSNHSLEQKTERDYYQEAIQKLKDNGATINDAVQCIHRYAWSDYAKDLETIGSKSEQASLDIYLQEKGERLVLYQRTNQERKVLTDKGNLYTYTYTEIKHNHSNGGEYLCVQASLPRITLIEHGLDITKTRQQMEEESREAGEKMEEKFKRMDEEMNRYFEE